MTDQEFIDRSMLLDGYFEFHRDWFDLLTASEVSDLDKVYGFRSEPDNSIEAMRINLSSDRELDLRAEQAFSKLLRQNGIE